MENTLPHSESAVAGYAATSSVESFDILYKRYVDKVYQKCLSMTKDTEVAWDFTQEIFIKAFIKFDSFQNRSAFSTWLYSISHHYCLDQLRSGKWSNTESLSEAAIKRLSESDHTAESIDSQLAALETVMNNLPAEEATMLRLKYEQGVSIREISQRYLISESAVKMRLMRSRTKLQTLYTNYYY